MELPWCVEKTNSDWESCKKRFWLSGLVIMMQPNRNDNRFLQKRIFWLQKFSFVCCRAIYIYIYIYMWMTIYIYIYVWMTIYIYIYMCVCVWMTIDINIYTPLPQWGWVLWRRSNRVAISVYCKPLRRWIEVSATVERMHVNNSNWDSQPFKIYFLANISSWLNGLKLWLGISVNRVSIPATGRYCLATLMSSDRTKQICLLMTIEIYILPYPVGLSSLAKK